MLNLNKNTRLFFFQFIFQRNYSTDFELDEFIKQNIKKRPFNKKKLISLNESFNSNLEKIKGLKMFKYLFLVISFISISFSSSAETIEIDMVNKLGKEKMVYSIKVAKIDIGDTIIWKSVDKGHNVEFVEMPKGVKKFKSKINKDAEYKFEIPGIYLYICTPHKAMGMIGLVVVGDDLSNLDKIKKAKMRGKSKKIFKELLKEL